MDHDGYISNGELFQVLKMMVGNNLKEAQLQQIVDKTILNADKDGDGKISFSEFCAVSMKHIVGLLMSLRTILQNNLNENKSNFTNESVLIKAWQESSAHSHFKFIIMWQAEKCVCDVGTVGKISDCQLEGPRFNHWPGQGLNFRRPSFATPSVDRDVDLRSSLLTFNRGRPRDKYLKKSSKFLSGNSHQNS